MHSSQSCRSPIAVISSIYLLLYLAVYLYIWSILVSAGVPLYLVYLSICRCTFIFGLSLYLPVYLYIWFILVSASLPLNLQVTLVSAGLSLYLQERFWSRFSSWWYSSGFLSLPSTLRWASTVGGGPSGCGGRAHSLKVSWNNYLYWP